MQNLFLLVCALIMIPMIFSVPVIYSHALTSRVLNRGMVGMLVSILIGIIAWIIFGYFEAFQAGTAHGQLSQLLTIWQTVPHTSELISLLVQLDFFLYAVIMFSGSLVPRFSWHFFTLFVPLWLLLVYGPLANLIWSPSGWLNHLGALDFSGGLVVHLTAGLTSLVMATLISRPKEQPYAAPIGNTNNYTAMVLIFVGWFGFNLAPLGQLSNLAGLIILNTLLAVLFATLGWGLAAYRRNKVLEMDELINGVICGLVTSTALVGYVSPFQMSLTALVSGLTCWAVTQACHTTNRFYDAVDSFSINAIGGLVGTVGLILFASQKVNPAGANGLLTGNGHFAGVELLAIAITALITIVGSAVAYWLSKTVLNRLSHPQEKGAAVNVKSSI